MRRASSRGCHSNFFEAQERRDEVPPQPVATQTYQPAATDNVPDVGFAFEKQPGHEQPQAGCPHRLLVVCTGVLEIDVAERLPGGVADDEARRVLVDHPRGREVGALPTLVS